MMVRSGFGGWFWFALPRDDPKTPCPRPRPEAGAVGLAPKPDLKPDQTVNTGIRRTEAPPETWPQKGGRGVPACIVHPRSLGRFL